MPHHIYAPFPLCHAPLTHCHAPHEAGYDAREDDFGVDLGLVLAHDAIHEEVEGAGEEDPRDDPKQVLHVCIMGMESGVRGCGGGCGLP